jgi:excisionase family DNA binding protein
MCPEFNLNVVVNAKDKEEANLLVEFISRIKGLDYVNVTSSEESTENKLKNLSSTTVTIPEAAEILGIDKGSVHYLVKKDILPSTKNGRQWFIDRASVENYQVSGRAKKRIGTDNSQDEMLSWIDQHGILSK